MTDERRIEELERRVSRLEAQAASAAHARVRYAPPAPPPLRRSVPPPPAPAPRPAAPRPAARTQPLEEVLGGRVLAWIGGVAILLGLAFFFALAISRGWIDESARTLLAAAAALAGLGVGVWLHEHRGRTDAALAVVAASVAALFLTVMVASEVYELIPSPAGVALALAVGAIATALAIRWDARFIAALGIVGALLSPALVDPPVTAAMMAYLFVAGLSAVGVVLVRRWDWLGFAVFVVCTPQWLEWLFGAASVGGALLALCAFGVLGAGAAIGYELRVPAAKLRPSSSFLLALNALVLAIAGKEALAHLGEPDLGNLWLAGLAAAHLLVGVFANRFPRVSGDIRLLVLVLGVVLADVAFGLVADGPVLAVGWAATGVFFARLVARSAGRRHEHALASVGLGGHIALALLNALGQSSSGAALGHSVGEEVGATIALAAVAAGAFTSARLTGEGHRQWRIALDALGLAVIAYLTAINLEGAQLVMAWALEAVVLVAIARREHDDVARFGAVAFLAGAIAHALAIEAPPRALVFGVPALAPAVVALLACAAAALMLVRFDLRVEWLDRTVFTGVAAVSLLYLVSVAVVTAYQPGTIELYDTVLDVGVRQQGQMLLSGLWGVVGVAALVVGLRRDWRLLRLGSLGLLLVTVGKVFMYDLATLDSVYRVVSFVALGLLLLAGAYAYQRVRPRPLPDLRTVPPGVR